MAKMNWTSASSRERVRRYGAERVDSDLRYAKNRTDHTVLDGKASELSCGSTDRNHRWGPLHSLPGQPGIEGRSCLRCGKTKVLKQRASKLVLLEESKLVRLQSQLTGQPPELPLPKGTVRSRRGSTSLSTDRRKPATVQPRDLKNFDSLIHVIHRVDSTRWKCLCAWKGVECDDIEKARELHRRLWERRHPDQRRTWDLQAIKASLNLIRSGSR